MHVRSAVICLVYQKGIQNTFFVLQYAMQCWSIEENIENHVLLGTLYALQNARTPSSLIRPAIDKTIQIALKLVPGCLENQNEEGPKAQLLSGATSWYSNFFSFWFYFVWYVFDVLPWAHMTIL